MIRIESIRIGERGRKDIGDVSSLSRSIQQIGVLHPIILKRDKDGGLTLASGARRLEALKALGYEQLDPKWYKIIDCNESGDNSIEEDDDSFLLRVERDENIERKPFTASEAAAIAKMLYDSISRKNLEKRKRQGIENLKNAAEARKKTAPLPSTEAETVSADEGDINIDMTANLQEEQEEEMIEAAETTETKDSPKNKTRTMDEIAKVTGWSRESLKKAIFVVDKAEENPEAYGKYKDEMDRTGKIDAAYKKALALATKMQRKKYEPSESLDRLANNSGDLQMPSFIYNAFLYLPQQSQEELIDKYGNIPLMVQQATFDRGLKVYSSSSDNGMPLSVDSLNEKKLYEMLDDVFSVTKEHIEKWACLDSVGSVATTHRLVIESKHASTLDKLEYFMITSCMSLNLFLKYTEAAIKDGSLPSQNLALESAAGLLNSLDNTIDTLFKAVAVQCRNVNGRTYYDAARQSANAMSAETLYEGGKDTMRYYKEKILNLLKKDIRND